MAGIWIGRVSVYAYVEGNPLTFVDESGLAAQVVVNGNNVSITIAITYTGPGASTPGVTASWNAAIANMWTGQFGQYNVTTQVVSGPDNQIYVPNGNGRAFVNFDDSSGTWPAERPDWTAAHEAGHLMGLPDEYNDITGPFPGFEHDIMGARGYGPSATDILDIIFANTPWYLKAPMIRGEPAGSTCP